MLLKLLKANMSYGTLALTAGSLQFATRRRDLNAVQRRVLGSKGRYGSCVGGR